MNLYTTKPWFECPIVCIDTEATSVGDDAAVCEVAAVRIEGRAITARWSSLIYPGCLIPAEATAIHGITDDMVNGKPPLAEVAGELAKICAGAVPCAYNADFDKRLLHAEVTGNDVPAFDPEQVWLDVMVIAKSVDAYVPGPGRMKLTEVCKRRGIVIPGAHRAEHDAVATAKLLLEFLGDSTSTMAGLLARTVKAKAEQDAEHRAFVKRCKAEDRAIWRQYACAALTGMCGREPVDSRNNNYREDFAAAVADTMLAMEKERFK